MRKLSTYFLLAASFMLFSTPAKANEVLQYQTCVSPQNNAVCLIAFEKLQTLINPISKERYYHDGLHIVDGEIFRYPRFFVATTDLDGDGRPEIIASVQEDGIGQEDSGPVKGRVCPEANICPHYIIQDRTLPDQNRTVDTLKALGPIYAYAIAQSTDERFDNFLSLRAYRDNTWDNFDVYQYDGETDQYFNMSVGP